MSNLDPPTPNVCLHLSEEQLTTTREHIVDFINDQVTTGGADGAVIALSGGVDSTLTAYLAVEALGPDRVHGLVMPSEVSEPDNQSDAVRVAWSLEIDYHVNEISSIVERVLDAYPAARDDTVAVGNVQARVRAVLNYLVANHESALVLGTGNRTEILTGYFTKYGDGAVDCLPIGNLYKQQVRQLARHVGVPDEIVKKTPTAELWEGQTDEDELGMTYEALDAILALHIDGPDPAVVSIRDASPADTILAFDTDEPLSVSKTAELVGVDERAIKRIRRLYMESAHKRALPPAPTVRFRG